MDLKTNLDPLLFRRLDIDDILFLSFLLLLGASYSLKGLVWDKPDPYHHLWFWKPQSDIAHSKGVETRDIGVKLEHASKDGVIFWGSQSGTAEGFANRLTRDCRRQFGLDMLSADLLDYDPESICNIQESKLAIFILSTYGEGDPSDNAVPLLAWLRTNQNANFPINMPTLRYATFGLGNSNYKFYNRVVDIVTEALDQFQAKPLLPPGKADDGEGATEEDFSEWKQNLFAKFRQQLGLQERLVHYEPSLKVVEDQSLDTIDLYLGEPFKTQTPRKATSGSSSVQPLPIKAAMRLLPNSDRNYLHVEIETAEYPELKYKTGDHLAVWPSNPKSEVNRLLRVLGMQEQKDMPLLISSLDASTPTNVPSPTNLHALFTHYLEICAPVPRESVVSISQYAPSPSAQGFLMDLSSSKERYSDYCGRNHVTLGRLLESALSSTENWSRLPLSFVLEALRPLQPRRYSVSSSSIVSPHTISLTISTTAYVVSEASEVAVHVPGLTTGYLTALSESLHSPQSSNYDLGGPSNLLSNSKIFASIVPSKFRLPVVSKHPLILVASGSGIAPFRGFLQERARLFKLGREVGPMILYFGCRSSDAFPYSDELATLRADMNGKLEIITAFSREGAKKTYVQNRIQEQVEEVIRMLNEDNAHFYICGSAAMARDVGCVIGEGVKRKMMWDDGALREWTEKLRRSRRWQEDVWG